VGIQRWQIFQIGRLVEFIAGNHFNINRNWDTEQREMKGSKVHNKKEMLKK